MTWPEIKSVSCDANHATAYEISIGLQNRPKGIVFSSSEISDLDIDARVMCVSMNPGATAFTVIFQGANALAQLFVNPEIADLAPA